jgi:hypothetical protein
VRPATGRVDDVDLAAFNDVADVAEDDDDDDDGADEDFAFELLRIAETHSYEFNAAVIFRDHAYSLQKCKVSFCVETHDNQVLYMSSGRSITNRRMRVSRISLHCEKNTTTTTTIIVNEK